MRILIDLINKILDLFSVLIIYRYGKAVGDQLCLTAVLEIIKKKKNKKIILFTNYPEFFLHNKSIYKLFSLKNVYKAKICTKIFRLFLGKNILEYGSPIKHENGLYFLSRYSKDIHLAATHLHNFEINFKDIKNVSCKIEFSEEEIKIYQKKFSLPNNFAVIQSETKTSFTKNKNWGTDNFQKVVDNMREINWVQVGNNEKILNNTINLTDKTNLREFAYIISRANFVLCLESLYNHVASAFNKKVFMICSGFIPFEHVKYDNTLPIYFNENLQCWPCYLISDCKIKGKPCTSKIDPLNVVQIIKKNLLII